MLQNHHLFYTVHTLTATIVRNSQLTNSLSFSLHSNKALGTSDVKLTVIVKFSDVISPLIVVTVQPPKECTHKKSQ